MALRVLARKLRFPANSALQRASAPVVSPPPPPPPSSRLLSSHSSQNGGAKRAVNGKNYKKLEKRLLRNLEEERKTFNELEMAIDNLPRNIVLTCTVGLAVFSISRAYAIGAFDGNRATNGFSEPSA